MSVTIFYLNFPWDIRSFLAFLTKECPELTFQCLNLSKRVTCRVVSEKPTSNCFQNYNTMYPITT